MTQIIKNLTNALICGAIAAIIRYFLSEAIKRIPDTAPSFLIDIKKANGSVLLPRNVQDDTRLDNTLIYDSVLCGILVFISTFLQTLVVQATHATVFKYQAVNNIMTGGIVSGLRYVLWKLEVLQKIPKDLPVIGGMHYLNETPKENSTLIIYKVSCALSHIFKKLIATIMCAEVKI